MSEEKIKLEDKVPNVTDDYLAEVGDIYEKYHEYKGNRAGNIKHFQNNSFESYLKTSRELFWNSMLTDSEDLRELGLEFSLPFIRKELLDFVGRIVSLNIAPKITGDELGNFGVKVLQAMYSKWRLKSKDKVEKFWQILYGATNGTLCLGVGFDGKESEKRLLRGYDFNTGEYRIDKSKIAMWNDAFSEIVPLEEIYLSKIWERNIQKQGKIIRKHEMTTSEFQNEFGMFKDSKYVVPGNRIDEDSLFFRLLEGTGLTTSDKIQVLKLTDTDNDKYTVVANGVWINRIGNDISAPMPFNHKSQPYVWSLNEPIDEKFAYGLSVPFKLKDPHKILNTSYTMMVERELRAIDPPILTSDFEAPQIIFGQKRVVPVNDINAYKELQIAEASGQFFTMQNSMQGLMSSFAQGGYSQVAPSRQPKAAREIIELNKMKQDALGNAMIMYYDAVYQEIILLLKTMLQFYKTKNYSGQDENILRTITVPNFALTQGGVGNLKVRIVKAPQDALKLYFEAVNESIRNGKMTEIIEVPQEILNNIEFFIDDIKLEPEKSSELERAVFYEQVIQPMLNVYIPSGVASIEKTFIAHMQKMGIHPADFSSDQATAFYTGNYSNRFNPQPVQPMQGQQTGNMMMSGIGTRFGGQSNGGFPAE